MTDLQSAEGTIVISHGKDGIIRVIGRGFWSEKTVRAYFKEVGRLITQYRSIDTSVRMLIDVADGAVQSSTTTARLNAALSGMQCPGDRIAIVARSTLVKLQSERIGKDLENHRTFRSTAEAEAWLSDRES